MPDTDLDRGFDDLVVEVERMVQPPGARAAVGRVRIRRAAVTAAGVLGLALGGIAVVAQDGVRPPPPHPAPVTRTEQPLPSGGEVFATSPLDGHWHTRPLSPAELGTLLRRAGETGLAARWAARPERGGARLTLVTRLMGGYSLWLGTEADPYRSGLGWGTLSEHGRRVRLGWHQSTTPTTTLRYTLTDGRVVFELVGSDLPQRNGVPGRERAAVLYTSLPFHRFVSAGPAN
ncbi:hypothetical protein ACT8ZV_12760 [Nocardioides sp. MAHUQ-72]|uniref:hypothetical protein n=1 Tax=unclassified Nocardioides TaxID=2615069 RepID=UPI00360F7AD8